MSVTKYTADGETWWLVKMWVYEGGVRRFKRKGRIATKEQAVRLAKTWAAESLDGTWHDRAAEQRITVADAWKSYSESSERLDSHASDKSRSAHLLRHLGSRPAVALNQSDVDAYRAKRSKETTRRRAPPSSASLDREIELLKRVLGYAVRCGTLRSNPLAGVALLRDPNVREVVITEEQFQERLARLENQSLWMRPALLVAFDTGMRISEVLGLRRDRIDWKTGRVELHASETKTEEARVIYLSARALDALKEVPAHLKSKLVFWRLKHGHPVARTPPRRGFHNAFGDGVWVHDLRRGFITNARRRGVPESVVMKMSGHKTSAVFRRYNIIEEDDIRDAQDRLEESRRFGGSPLDRSGEK